MITLATFRFNASSSVLGLVF